MDKIKLTKHSRTEADRIDEKHEVEKATLSMLTISKELS